MDSIEVKEADDVIMMPNQKPWYIPMVDSEGSGMYWYSLCSQDTVEKAMESISGFKNVKQARIILVMLPCKDIK